MFSARGFLPNLWDMACGHACTPTCCNSVQPHSTFVPMNGGGQVLTASADGTARLWHKASGAGVQTFKSVSADVNSAAIAPDGLVVATCSSDATATLWDVPTGKVLMVLCGHQGPVWSVAFSSDSQSLVTGSADRTAKIWSRKAGECSQTLVGHADEITCARFGAGRVATCSKDNSIILWQTRKGHQEAVFRGHQGPVFSLAFSVDGFLLVTASADLTAKLWNSCSGECTRSFVGHAASVNSAVIGWDKSWVVTGSHDKTARLWHASSGDCLQEFIGHSAQVISVALSGDARVVTGSCDGRAKLWSVRTGQCEQTYHDDHGHHRAVTSVEVLEDAVFLEFLLREETETRQAEDELLGSDLPNAASSTWGV